MSDALKPIREVRAEVARDMLDSALHDEDYVSWLILEYLKHQSEDDLRTMWHNAFGDRDDMDDDYDDEDSIESALSPADSD
jgi:hypothetical protein